MKRKYILTIALLFLGLASCKKDFLNLSPPDKDSSASFYKTESDFLQALSGAYNLLRASHGNANNSCWDMGEMRSDNTYFDLNEQNRGVGALQLEDIANFTDDAVNGNTQSKWIADYSGISKVNSIIDRLPTANFENNLKVPIMAQAKFLRALWYLDLVQYYGGVPLQVHEVTKESQASLPRSSVASVYGQIVSDALDAAGNLAPASNFPQSGRATAGAAKTLLGHAYLLQKKYDLAEKQLKDVTQMSYALNSPYASAFLPANKNSKESIFEIQYLNTVGLGQESRFIYQWLPVASGVSVLTGAVPNSPNSNGGYNVPSLNLINAYERNDQRLDASIGVVEGVLLGNTFTPERMKSIIGYTLPPGKTARRVVRKFLHTHAVTGNSDENFPVYRYSDVLLMLAEALNEQNKSGEALPYLNAIRNRAGLLGATSLDPNTLRGIIAHERRIELAFENKRWLDLVRSGQAVQVMNAYGTELKMMLTNISPNAYNVTSKRLIFPIPKIEMERNVTLVGNQNPGY
ncbi:RagB/SusD family nutrient uptake outer membrane protein [Pedobacter sp. HMWF019]|uniref:RagB/SusD family nutrient uptake outer membrane protein n=1 Tax=Pedobacter sp. HMWF019 TaxID=2056856 RepID=UPI000D39AE1E|nr:RagB/SusD family nutrient uptake outer membrane protein [Pedobacter sp. HMWF019]PTT02175.1 RagB/SusD family nutrient uptake outer membrane protein [Pedobacter sp. HMWF019]